MKQLILIFTLFFGTTITKIFSQTELICPADSIPSGWILIGTNKCKCCNNSDYGIQWSIKKISSTSQSEEMCPVSAINKLPKGWLIVDKENCECCHASGDGYSEKWTIKNSNTLTSGSTMEICEGNKIPAGWVLINKEKCNCCSKSGYGNKWTIKKL